MGAVKKPKYRSDDINLLLPSFIPVVQAIVDDMRAAGYDPVLFDTLRTRAEAARNFKRGTGSKDSIHCYGAAADVICGDHGWSCAAHACGFFTKLQERAEARGCLSGATFSSVDRPHFQGISLAQQAAMRKLGTGPESVGARDALVQKFLGRKR